VGIGDASMIIPVEYLQFKKIIIFYHGQRKEIKNKTRGPRGLKSLT